MKLSITNEFSAGAVGWYRGHGVIGHLPIEWKNPDNQNWVEMMDTSIQLLIRPWNQRFASLMYISEINGVPVWSDFDDDYLAIPEHNRAYPILKKHEPNFEQITKEIIKNSKVVTVTTEYLKNNSLSLILTQSSSQMLLMIIDSNFQRRRVRIKRSFGEEPIHTRWTWYTSTNQSRK